MYVHLLFSGIKFNLILLKKYPVVHPSLFIILIFCVMYIPILIMHT